MAKRYPFVTDVRGVVAASNSGTMTARIPAAGRLQNVKMGVRKSAALATLAVMRSSLREMRFVLPNLNSEVIRRIRPADYLAILEANGYVNEDGLFPLFFAEPWRALVMDEERLALETRRYGDRVDLEIDVVNDANPLDFNFDLEFDDRQSVDAQGNPVLGIMDFTTQVENPGGGNPTILLDSFNGPLQRVWISTPSTVTVSRVKVLAGASGNVVLYDRTQTATRPSLKQQLKDMGMKIPATYGVPGGTNANLWPVVFDNNQQLRNNITEPGVPIRVELEMTAGAEVRLIRETMLAR